jgi:glutathione S-transferase
MGLLDAFRGTPSADSAVYNSVVDAAPSWDALRELSASAGGAKLRAKWEAEAAGRGVASHQANLRLFDAPDGTEPTVELFRDTAAWCP